MDPQNDSQPHNDAAPKSRDAVRSRAWRNRHSQHLQGLLKAAGVEAQDGSARSHMATLKKVFAGVWAQALVAAPASMIRHDPSLTRAERRRISSVKNNRLCRHRHHVFLQGIERELQGRGLLPAGMGLHQGSGEGHRPWERKSPEFGAHQAPASPHAPATPAHGAAHAAHTAHAPHTAHPAAPQAGGQPREAAHRPEHRPAPASPPATGPVPVRSLRPHSGDKY